MSRTTCPGIERLSVRDATNLQLHHGGIQMVIGWLAVLEPGDTTVADVRAAVERRLGRVPRLRQRIRALPRGLGPPTWQDDPDFDLDRHVRRRDVAPGRPGELLAVAEELFRQPLDLDHPPWRLHVLVDERPVAMVQLVHHALADGAAAAAMAAALMDVGPDPEPAAWRPRPAPARRRLLLDNVRWRLGTVTRALRRLWPPGRLVRRSRRLAREVRAMLGAQRDLPTTSLNRSVGPDRRLAVREWSLAAVADAGHRLGATVNDLVLAAAAQGLRDLLARRGDPVDELRLHAAVPVSVRADGADDALGNRTSSMLVPLHVDEPDAVARLHRISGATRALKADGAALALNGLMDSPFVPAALHRRVDRFTRHQRLVHLFVTNVRGPTDRLAMTGVPVRRVVPIVPLTGNVPIGLGVISWADRLVLGIRTCPDRVPDVEVFANGLDRAMDTLVTASAGVPTPG